MFQNAGSQPIGFLHAAPSVAGRVRPVPNSPRGVSPRRVGKTRLRVLPTRIHVTGTAGFLRWLARDYPAAYAKLAAERPGLLRAGSGGLGQIQPAVNTTVGQQIADFVLPLLSVYQQQQVLKLQLKRAKAGQPPLELDQYAAPPARFELEAGEKTQRTALLIAGTLGLVGLAYFLSRPRARA